MFALTIETSNDAFTEDASIEVARILREIADRIERGQTEIIVRDINGNRAGKAELTLDD